MQRNKLKPSMTKTKKAIRALKAGRTIIPVKTKFGRMTKRKLNKKYL